MAVLGVVSPGKAIPSSVLVQGPVGVHACARSRVNLFLLDNRFCLLRQAGVKSLLKNFDVEIQMYQFRSIYNYADKSLHVFTLLASRNVRLSVILNVYTNTCIPLKGYLGHSIIL